MEFNYISETNECTNTRVVDSGMIEWFIKLFFTYGLITIITILLFIFYRMNENSITTMLYKYISIIFSVIFIYKFYRWNANRKGFIIKDNKFYYPGEFYQPKSIISYFNPLFLLRKMIYKNVDIKDIRHIKQNDSSIYINGNFGAIKCEFKSGSKQSELMSSLIKICNMGERVNTKTNNNNSEHYIRVIKRIGE